MSPPDEGLRRLLEVEGAATRLLHETESKVARLLAEAETVGRDLEAGAAGQLESDLAELEARLLREREVALAAIEAEAAQRLVHFDQVEIEPLAERLLARLLQQDGSEPGDHP